MASILGKFKLNLNFKKNSTSPIKKEDPSRELEIGAPFNVSHDGHIGYNPLTEQFEGSDTLNVYLQQLTQRSAQSTIADSESESSAAEVDLLQAEEVDDIEEDYEYVCGTAARNGNAALDSDCEVFYDNLENMPLPSPIQQSVNSDTEAMAEIKNLVNEKDPCPNYQLLKKIGYRGSGAMHIATNLENKSKVAIKRMNLSKQFDKHCIVTELLVMQGYPHPNLVRFIDAHLIDNHLWIIMDYTEGISLSGVIAAVSSGIEEYTMAVISRHVLNALNFLHTQGIIHRDIKSANILIGSDGTDGSVKITNLGWCKQMASEKDKCTEFVGTPHWIAPEIAHRQPYGVNADIWSWGITVAEMISGAPPYFHESPVRAIEIIKSNRTPSIEGLKEFTPQFQDFVHQCLIVDCNQRPSAKELLQLFDKEVRTPMSIPSPMDKINRFNFL